MIDEPKTEKEARYACPPSRFDAHLRALKKAGYTLVTPKAVEEYLLGGAALPPMSVLITIDDGFRDNYEQALPVLREQQAPALIFLATSKIAGHNDWMAGTDYPRRPMLTWDQVREMHREGIQFGGHTMTHPRLSQLNREQALAEIAGSQAALRAETGIEAKWFAYPYGDLDENTPGVVQDAGFSFACTTRSGFNSTNIEPLLLRRLEVYGTDPAWKLLQKLRFGTNEASLFRPLRYYLGRIGNRLGLTAN